MQKIDLDAILYVINKIEFMGEQSLKYMYEKDLDLHSLLNFLSVFEIIKLGLRLKKYYQDLHKSEIYLSEDNPFINIDQEQ